MSEAVPSSEPSPSPAAPKGQRFALVAGLVAVALLAAFGIAFGFGGRPRSPEALYERVAELNEQGRTTEIWDLMTEESRKEFRDTIAGHRDLMTRNPGLGMTEQYHCTRKEFMELPYEEIFRRENSGYWRVFIGAKITDKQVDPRFPDDMTMTIEPPAGPLVMMQVRKVGRGWELVRIRPVTR